MEPGYYDQSYPRSVLHPPAEEPVALTELPQTGAGDAPRTAAGSPALGATAGTSPLTVDAGTPGSYTPAVKPSERPRNVTELAERATPNGAAPWDAGQFVQVGTSGRRAHWSGAEWRGGESPGYAPADTQFPGTADTPEDLTR